MSKLRRSGIFAGDDRMLAVLGARRCYRALDTAFQPHKASWTAPAERSGDGAFARTVDLHFANQLTPTRNHVKHKCQIINSEIDPPKSNQIQPKKFGRSLAHPTLDRASEKLSGWRTNGGGGRVLCLARGPAGRRSTGHAVLSVSICVHPRLAAPKRKAKAGQAASSQVKPSS